MSGCAGIGRCRKSSKECAETRSCLVRARQIGRVSADYAALGAERAQEKLMQEAVAGKPRPCHMYGDSDWTTLQTVDTGQANSPMVTDHADAAAGYLERFAKLIRAGKSVEDAGSEMLPVIRIMARRV